MSGTPVRGLDAVRMSSPPVCKVPRDRVMSLAVHTAICPQVTLRVLGVLAQRSLIPFTIAVERRARSMWLVIELDALTGPEAELLVSRIEAIVMVRKATVAQRSGRSRR